MTSINIMDGNKCSHLAGIPRPSSCTPQWSVTSEEDPPHLPHQLHATSQLAGPDVKARPLPKHSPPYLPTYCTPEWPATRTGTCCTASVKSRVWSSSSSSAADQIVEFFSRSRSVLRREAQHAHRALVESSPTSDNIMLDPQPCCNHYLRNPRWCPFHCLTRVSYRSIEFHVLFLTRMRR